MSEGRVIGAVGARAKPRIRGKDISSLINQSLKDWVGQESGRFILWSPVAMICGVGLYFSLPAEPALWPFLALVSFFGGGWWTASQSGRVALSLVCRLLFFITLGLSLATLRTASVEAPVLPRAVGPVGLEGILLKKEDRTGDQRLTIAPLSIGALKENQIPVKIRVTWRGDPSDIEPGDRVRIFGPLTPPPGPAIPGGFDYGRQLYFDRIGGVGFLYDAPEVLERAERPALSLRIELWRDRMAARIERLAPGDAAPVLAALVTGQRDGIPPQITEHLRDTGLAHLLAISGLHMGLVCGLVFFGLRFLFACHPRWAAKYPIKKWAALGGMIGGLIYLIISGAPVSAQRAFIMAMIGFLAILMDRRAISLRNVALAALVIILLSPEAVMSAGFQMSFAAVMALVATYDWSQKRQRAFQDRGIVGRVAIFFGALFVTSLVAGLATSPMAIFHFNRIATYGLGANLLVMPIFTLIVMPGAVLGLVLMPLGLDAFVWPVVGAALNLILGLTETIAAQDGAVMDVPQWSGVAWGLVMAGMITLCIMTSPLRLIGVVLGATGLMMAPFSDRPEMMIAEDLKNIAVLDGAGEMHLLSRQRARFTIDQWRQMHGISTERRELPVFACDTESCRLPLPRFHIVYTEDIGEAAFACRNAQVVIYDGWDAQGLHGSCGAMLLTAETVGQGGPLSLYRHGRGFRIKQANNVSGNRPWSQ